MTKLDHRTIAAIYPTFDQDYYQNFYQWAVDSLEEQCRINPDSSSFDAPKTYQKFMDSYFPYIEGYRHWNYVQKRFSNVFYDHVEEWKDEFYHRLPRLFETNNRMSKSVPLPVEYHTPKRKATSIITNFVEQEQEQTKLNIFENSIQEEQQEEQTPNIVSLPTLANGKEFNIHIHVSAPLTVEYHENGLIIS